MAAPSDTLTARAADIPSVDRVLRHPKLASLAERYGRGRVTAALRIHLESLRRAARGNALARASLDEEAVATALDAQLQASAQSRLRPVYNLTGTVLHTNLGRALLPDEAVRAVMAVMTTPVNLEFDLASGARG